MPPTRARPRTAPLVVGVVLVLLLGALALPAGAASGPAGTLLARLNDARTARGLAPLAPVGDLESVATTHSRRMAASGDLHHNPSLGSQVRNWRVVAENVGRGPDADQLHRMFMESSTHVANILDERVTQVGVGVVDVDGQLWVTQVFREPLSTSRPSRSSTAPPPEPSPARPAVSTPVPDPRPPATVVGVAAATATRAAPVPASIGVAAATTTTSAPAPTDDVGFLVAAARWVARLF